MPRIAIISDFNAANLAALISQDRAEPVFEALQAPFGQHFQALSDGLHPIWSNPIDCLIVWTLPQRVISTFARACDCEQVDTQAVLAEVDDFAEVIKSSQRRARLILVPAWTLPPWHRGNGLREMREEDGLRALLGQMNQRLAYSLGIGSSQRVPAANIFVLDATRWISTVGARAFSPKAWYLAKIPWTNDVFKLAVADTKAAFNAVSGRSRKLVVIDLDETIWGGILGDVGWEKLILGGHDGEGEALADFQRALKGLSRRGVLLGVVSKNDEAVALEAMRKHPEMILRPEDIAGWRINWNDKAQNIAELAAELNLGMQSVVFIDDNPVERARVRDELPEVFVPEWPADKTQYPKALLELACFDSVSSTAEDVQRTAMYASDRERKELLRTVGSLDDWLTSLKVSVEIEPLQESNLARATQLLNKTNQMNLSTRRMTELELFSWSQPANQLVWTFRVRDKFGDSGLTGILGLETNHCASDGTYARITDFLLSCRVMGRKIEETMLATAVSIARKAGMQKIVAVYVPTSKNKPCHDFFRRSGFIEDPATGSFSWIVEEEYAYPAQVAVTHLGVGEADEAGCERYSKATMEHD
jgi:FkbH-like protein